MGIPFTVPMGFLFTMTIGFLFTIALGIQLTISTVAFSTGGTDGTGSPGGRGAIPTPIENYTNGDAFKRRARPEINSCTPELLFY